MTQPPASFPPGPRPEPSAGPSADPSAGPSVRASDPDADPGASRDRRWLVLAAIGVAQLMVVLDTTIVNIALPQAQADLGFDTSHRQWVVTAYALAFGSLLLLGGRLSDLVGRRRTLVVGLIGFAVASAVGGAATGFEMLVGARAAQGIFAALLAPAALSTLNVTFTDAKSRGKAFGVYSAIAGGGAVVGLILGGFLTEYLSWRWCLYVNLLLAVPAAIGVLAWVPAQQRTAARARLDWPGVLAVAGGLFCLVYGLSNAETDSWGAPLTVTMLVLSAVLLTAFVLIERRVSAPLLPLRVVLDRNRAGAYIAIALTFCSMFGVFLFLTYYLQEGLGYSAVKSGLAFLPLPVGLMVAAGAANTRLVPRFGPRPLVPVGMLLGAGAMWWLAQLEVTSTYAGDVMGPLFLLGLGVGLVVAPSITAATSGVALADAGVGSAMVNTTQQIGGAVGTAVLSTIFSSAVAGYLDDHAPSGAGSAAGSATQAAVAQLQAAAAVHGYAVGFAVCCGILLTGFVTSALFFRSGPLAASEGDHAGVAL